MTATANGAPKLCKLLTVDIRVTGLASRRHFFEIRMIDPCLQVRGPMAIGTFRVLVSPSEWECGFRMIVVGVSPSFRGMAYLTIKLGSIRR